MGWQETVQMGICGVTLVGIAWAIAWAYRGAYEADDE